MTKPNRNEIIECVFVILLLFSLLKERERDSKGNEDNNSLANPFRIYVHLRDQQQQY